MPQLITWTGTTKRIEFVYTATGQKLRKVVTAANGAKTIYDYHNGIEYKNGNLDAIYHAEGRVTKVGSDYSYEYALKDHLGNARVFFSNRGARALFIEADDILQESHYYAFGMAYDTYPWGTTTTPNKYQYNGKELNDELGLNWAHHDWRFFDATVGRFWSVDPKAEEEDQETMSPYHFSYNNPIRYSDPDGQCPTCLIGAIIQGGLELGGQLVSNGGDLKQVDWADVGVEVGKGALKGTGIGLIGTVIVEGSGVVVKASFDYTTEKGAENVVNGKKTASAAIIDGVLDVTLGKVADIGLGKIQKNLSTQASKAASTARAANSNAQGAKKYAEKASQSGSKPQAKAATNAAKVAATNATKATNRASATKAASNTAKSKATEVIKNAVENKAAEKIKGDG